MLGTQALGYPSVAHGIFQGGESGLVHAFLQKCRREHLKATEAKLASDEWKA